MGERARRDGDLCGLDPDDPVVKADRNWHERGWAAGPHFRAMLSINQVQEMMTTRGTEYLAPHHITGSRHEALAVLYFSRDGQMSLGKLGQRLMVHPTSVTAVVDTLERLGLVERAAHPSDRRQTLARITGLGRTTMEKASQEMGVDAYGLGALTEAEAEALCLLLKKVRRAAGLDRQGTAGAEAS
ncbi:MAG: MarR family transcriptional regulator [Ilumatobacteraceae bacterium]